MERILPPLPPPVYGATGSGAPAHLRYGGEVRDKLRKVTLDFRDYLMPNGRDYLTPEARTPAFAWGAAVLKLLYELDSDLYKLQIAADQSIEVRKGVVA